MSSRPYSEELVRQFRAWEERGRGSALYPFPVSLEPSFRPFVHRHLSARELDDGRKPTALSRLAEFVLGGSAPSASREESEPEPRPHQEEELSELRLFLPREFRASRESREGFLRSLLVLAHPLSWEIVSMGGRIRYQVAVARSDRAALSAAASAFLPEVSLSETPPLSALWSEEAGGMRVLEFALRREFMIPLAADFSPSPLLAFLSLASQVEEKEVLALQVRFVPTKRDWKASILRSVRTPAGTPFFSDCPEITRFAETKVSAPLFAVSVRVAVKAFSRDRLLELSRLSAGALGSLGRENELVLLPQSAEGSEDFLGRRSHRPGMLLSLPELALLVHAPGDDVRVPGLLRGVRKEKKPPEEALSGGLLLGETLWKAERTKVFLPEEARLRHTHVIGATGTGKTTLLLNLILEDIRAGRGVGVIDPHGDMASEILSRLPEERLSDLILLDPSDQGISGGWNALEARSEAEREVLSSDLVSLFRRYSTSFGDQMVTVLSNAVAALLSLPEEYTISDLRRFLVDRRWRESLIPRIADEELSFFWQKEFSHIGERSLGPILGRLNTFIRSRPIRESVSRPGGIDFRKLLDEGGILIARLPIGLLGEENVAVLGSLLVSKLQQAALSRTDQRAGERNSFHLFLDECHLFATPSLSLILSGARKFGLSLTLAHQSLAALHGRLSEVEGSILANCHTRLVFRVGEEDCRTLERSLSTFAADDLLDLKTGEAICRLGAKENTFRVSVPMPQRLSADEETEALARVRTYLLGKRGMPEPQRETAEQPPAPRMTDPLPVLYQVEPKAKSPTVPVPEREALPKEAPPEPHRPGKGGPEHTYLQELVKRWAEECGFRAAVEEQVPGGRESIDVALYRGDVRIACEISVTTPLEYEVGNVEKCLAAGFGEVALVSLKRGRLEKLGKLLSDSLPPESRKRVQLFTPEELLSWLDRQPVQEKAGVVGGYKVKVRYQAPEGGRSKRVAEILAKSMSRLQKEKE